MPKHETKMPGAKLLRALVMAAIDLAEYIAERDKEDKVSIPMMVISMFNLQSGAGETMLEAIALGLDERGYTPMMEQFLKDVGLEDLMETKLEGEGNGTNTIH